MSDRPSHTPKDTHYANLRRAHRERLRDGPDGKADGPDGIVQLYGIHTVEAALANPARRLLKLSGTRNALNRLRVDVEAPPCPLDLVEPRALDRLLGSDAVHQGILLEAEALPVRRLADLGDTVLVLVLDQVTDPHNVGAIIRSAAAFGAGAVITTSRHSPQESGVLAKAASGALEHVPYIQITNLSDGLNDLAARAYQTIGLDSDGQAELESAFLASKIALVLGSEGKGLRQKTRETVSALARLEMPGAIRSLNVSNASAVALYAARRHLQAKT